MWLAEQQTNEQRKNTHTSTLPTKTYFRRFFGDVCRRTKQQQEEQNFRRISVYLLRTTEK